MWFAKTIKNLKLIDLSLIKLSVFFFAFFVASYIDNNALIGGRWIWLALGIIFVIKPLNIAMKHM
ncbi:hypothetical protein HYT56_01100 [Candidatus Woesearchaeota archaeon]|nr:hypothetical protein [Candidatus Woesearchaeota archaeon]